MRINCLTDNSSAVGWLFKANFDPNTQQKHDVIARHMARILLDFDTALYPQHIPGDDNIIADSLSRDFHISNTNLQFMLNSLFPQKAPKQLRILQTLPREIISWLESMQDMKTSASESLPAPSPSKMGALVDGSDSLRALVSKINSWIRFHKRQELPSCARLRLLLGEMSRAEQNLHSSSEERSARPSTMFVRYSEQTFVNRQ